MLILGTILLMLIQYIPALIFPSHVNHSACESQPCCEILYLIDTEVIFAVKSGDCVVQCD